MFITALTTAHYRFLTKVRAAIYPKPYLSFQCEINVKHIL